MIISKEEIVNVMRDFVKVAEKGDVEKTPSFFTEDAVWLRLEVDKTFLLNSCGERNVKACFWLGK